MKRHDFEIETENGFAHIAFIYSQDRRDRDVGQGNRELIEVTAFEGCTAEEAWELAEIELESI